MPITRRELITGAAAGAGGLVIGGVTGSLIGGGDDGGGGGGETSLSGQAAKVAPPAVMNQVWLPSQVGPMELIRMRRSVSFLPAKGSIMPTPKSKPSVRAKPMMSTPTKAHQISLSVS